MAYKHLQIDEFIPHDTNGARVRKVAKRAHSRKLRQNVRKAIRLGQDAIDMITAHRGPRFDGYAS